MTDLIQCDACAAISPDPKSGHHVANHWTNVLVQTHFPRREHEMIFCEKCLPMPRAVGGILNRLFKHFGIRP